MNTFGRDLKELRESRGRTQEQLATSVGVTPVFISMLECGRRKPSLRTAEKIAEALGVFVVFGLEERGQ